MVKENYQGALKLITSFCYKCKFAGRSHLTEAMQALKRSFKGNIKKSLTRFHSLKSIAPNCSLNVLMVPLNSKTFIRLKRHTALGCAYKTLANNSAKDWPVYVYVYTKMNFTAIGSHITINDDLVEALNA